NEPGAVYGHVAGSARLDFSGTHDAFGTGPAGECATRRDLPDGDRKFGRHGVTVGIRGRRGRWTPAAFARWRRAGGTVRRGEAEDVDFGRAQECRAGAI